jgi:hypothetical protein
MHMHTQIHMFTHQVENHQHACYTHMHTYTHAQIDIYTHIRWKGTSTHLFLGHINRFPISRLRNDSSSGQTGTKYVCLCLSRCQCRGLCLCLSCCQCRGLCLCLSCCQCRGLCLCLNRVVCDISVCVCMYIYTCN